MTRTNSVNFTGANQYPIANAATDLFKKEDVQVLAKAHDLHDHSAGLGLPVDMTVVAAGSITTAKLAANAITQVGYAVGTTANPTTTSGTFVDMPEMSVTLTTVGGRLVAFLAVSGYVSAGPIGNAFATALSLDAAAEVGSQYGVPSALNYQMPISTFHDFGSPAAGSHTIKGRWAVTGSGTTMALNGTQRRLLVVELKR